MHRVLTHYSFRSTLSVSYIIVRGRRSFVIINQMKSYDSNFYLGKGRHKKS